MFTLKVFEIDSDEKDPKQDFAQILRNMADQVEKGVRVEENVFEIWERKQA